MKNFLLILLTIGCGAFLFIGNMYWQERTAVSSYGHHSLEADSDPSPVEEKPASILNSNWPEKAQRDYQAAKEKGQTYKLAIVGSPSLGKDENGWSVQLKEDLEKNYGETLEVSIFQYDTDTSHFINGEESDEVISYSPDLVLFEPFSLINNSVGVLPTDNHYSINIFMKKLKGANENTVLILQPPHPVYGATFYPKNIEELKDYAEENDITYLNHWEDWPTDESLRDLLVHSQDTPNEKGHSIWADYLKDYFISGQE
ncbi:SGNH/GDSL hydrolase family protein [Rossellomorea aquimaris]|uniref:SGNH/GDSL hydrolase family protein n=1 Tax=Rossellomorea aquimaris TaxID=189382 RepID=UPI001CFE06F1|nr:hypothetical protein [Rossellomorea aquimaris]